MVPIKIQLKTSGEIVESQIEANENDRSSLKIISSSQNNESSQTIVETPLSIKINIYKPPTP